MVERRPKVTMVSMAQRFHPGMKCLQVVGEAAQMSLLNIGSDGGAGAGFHVGMTPQRPLQARIQRLSRIDPAQSAQQRWIDPPGHRYHGQQFIQPFGRGLPPAPRRFRPRPGVGAPAQDRQG